MDDVKNQFKGLVKKFNKPFASSSSRFKGEGHKLGNGQESSQQASLQQADWRKLQQERWEKERFRNTTPLQDRSNPSAALSAQSQPSTVPNADHSSAHAPVSSLDTSSECYIGSSNAILSDAAVGLNVDHSGIGISDATNLQKGDGSDSGLHLSETHELPNLDHVSKDAVKLPKREDINTGSFVNPIGNMDLTEVGTHESLNLDNISKDVVKPPKSEKISTGGFVSPPDNMNFTVVGTHELPNLDHVSVKINTGKFVNPPESKDFTEVGASSNNLEVGGYQNESAPVNVDHSGISDATNSQKDDGSDSGLDLSEARELPNLDKVSKDVVKPSTREEINTGSFVNHEGNMDLTEVSGLSSNNSKVDRSQNESTSRFDPFSSQIGSLSSSTNMSGMQMYQCPVCGSWWKSETEVNAHVDECLNQSTCTSSDNMECTVSKLGDDQQIKVSLGVFLSGAPSGDTMDVFLRILRNIVSSPDSEKFRKIRLSNPKIHETLGMALGGVELLEAVGFTYQTEEEEIWAIMDHPSIDKINVMQGIISQLEACVRGLSREEIISKGKAPLQRKVDRQVRVFYAAPENVAAKMELPDSFFRLSASELRQEVATRKKKLEDSQLLVSRVSRDRMAAANKRRYKASIIRIQFPDGVVLQGMFLPWERTTAIYEFVSNSLRDPSTQFTLAAPGPSRKQVIPAFAEGATKIPTLEEANLVPAVLVKFQCVDSDVSTFTGLHPDILVAIEPLSSTTFRSQ